MDENVMAEVVTNEFVTLGFGCSCSISVTPKTLAALSQVFHFTQLRFKTGLKGCARSMPTSAALDLVAKKILVINYVRKNAVSIWVFPKIMVPKNGWFIMENPYFWKHPSMLQRTWAELKDPPWQRKRVMS